MNPPTMRLESRGHTRAAAVVVLVAGVLVLVVAVIVLASVMKPVTYQDVTFEEVARREPAGPAFVRFVDARTAPQFIYSDGSITLIPITSAHDSSRTPRGGRYAVF